MMVLNTKFQVAAMAGGLLLFVAGCQAPVERLRTHVRLIREAAGEMDSTVRVLVILCPEEPPNRALAALYDPKNLYLATNRFVTAVINEKQVTLYHRQKACSFQLSPRLYGLAAYYLGGRDLLCKHLVGHHDGYRLYEHLVVADLDLNPIEHETPGSNDYPSLLAVYSKFSQEDYEKWLGTLRWELLSQRTLEWQCLYKPPPRR